MLCACNQEQRKENGLAKSWLSELASREESYAFEGIRQNSMGTNCETVVLVHAGVLNLSKYSKWQKIAANFFFFFIIQEMPTFATFWSLGCFNEAHDEKVESDGRFTMTQESIDFREIYDVGTSQRQRSF